jgi:prepilin-type N-terminal cleavage/methylation domain-containing protein
MRNNGLKKTHGFTLVELLVVIAIIAVLLAVLMPALGKVKWMAKVNTCRNNFKQFGMAFNLYAGDYGGSYPSYRLSGTVGANPWDVYYKYVDDMRNKYNIPLKMFYCPAAQGAGHTGPYPAGDMLAYVDLYSNILTPSAKTNPTQTPSDYVTTGAGMVELRQSLWVPRQMNNGLWWPAPGGVPSAEMPKKYSAPLKDSDPTRSLYPVMTDVCYSSNGPTGGGGANLVNDSRPISELIKTIDNGGHKRNDVVESTNSVFGDGHVETNKMDQLRPRYYGNMGTHWW